MWILTSPWLLFSLRGRRKRCQHDPGSRLWRGSGGKSKTLSIRSPHWCAALTVFLLTFPVKIPLTYRDMNTDDSSLWAAIVLCRGSKDDRMRLGSSKRESLNSSHLCEVSVTMGSDTSLWKLWAEMLPGKIISFQFNFYISKGQNEMIGFNLADGFMGCLVPF